MERDCFNWFCAINLLSTLSVHTDGFSPWWSIHNVVLQVFQEGIHCCCNWVHLPGCCSSSTYLSFHLSQHKSLLQAIVLWADEIEVELFHHNSKKKRIWNLHRSLYNVFKVEQFETGHLFLDWELWFVWFNCNSTEIWELWNSCSFRGCTMQERKKSRR